MTVQIQRTTHPKRYQRGQAPVGGVALEIARGERTNYDQYLLAIQSAKRTIYLENQAVEVLEILDALRQALERGVEVVLVMLAPQNLLPATTLNCDNSGASRLRRCLGSSGWSLAFHPRGHCGHR